MLKVSDVPKWPLGREKRVDFIQRTWCLIEERKLEVEDHVVDDVMAEDDGLAEFVGFVAEDEVVRTEVGGDFKAAHAPNGFAAEGHGGAEGELHAFHCARREHA